MQEYSNYMPVLPLTIQIADNKYPALLQATPRPPKHLYYYGDISLISQPALTIVGSRRISSYGEQVCQLLIPSIVESGLAIVSGLAYGVDAYAHQIALRAGGKCVAVLAGGLDVGCPAGN